VTGPNKNSADSGAQGDQVFVAGECKVQPGPEQVAYLSALKLAARPNHLRRPDGSPMDPAEVATVQFWHGRPHAQSTHNLLGKSRGIEAVDAHGWWGPDTEHWLANGLAVAARVTGSRALQETAANLLRLVEDVRDAALRLRMTPIGEVFNRFPRVVRDLARELGKDIELVIRGAEAELDKSMVEKIGDPLMHLVRNALDHGIESPERRAAAGKPARGRVELRAFHESGSIVIEVADDGGGLDARRILAKAVERGLVAADAVLSEAEIHRLVLAPGFSTAAELTSLSGRGVGMDVVKSSVDALRGTLDIHSAPGCGTTMRLCLPLTLAIIDGFQVGVAGATFILPLDAVVECIELPADAGAAGYLDLRGQVLPFLRLRALFALEGAPPPRQNVVVVRFGGRQAGIAVDHLLGECQAVIKPLGPLFERVAGIAGSTILGSGEVALILDVPQLVQRAIAHEGRDTGGAPRARFLAA